MKKLQIRNSLLLFLTACIWGCAFVAQSVSMDYIEPFTFNGVRSLIGAVFLIPCSFVISKMQGQQKEEKQGSKRDLLIGGLLCGLIMFVASNLQQFGILYTSVGKSGFLTALYIVLVPVLGLFFGKKAGKKLWIAVACALLGLYLLCMKTGSTVFEIGDVLLLLCALGFSFHIIVVDHFSPLVDGVKLSMIQFFVCGVLSIISMFLFEDPSLTNILAAWQPVLYAGIMSCGVAYTLQIIGQNGLNPTVASLIMSLESVVSAIAGWLILGQVLSNRELLGCFIVFIAIVLAQLPDKSGS